LAGEVLGIGRRAASLAAAERVGAVSRSTLNLAEGVAEADLIIVCTPVAEIVDHVRSVAAAAPRGALITDAGSTKGWIVGQLAADLAPGARFVGSHPLAGSERSGAAHADADLFAGRVAVLTPTPATPQTDVAETARLWQGLGAVVCELSPEAHDRTLAATSHVPHLVAYALAASVPEADWPFAGGGLRDTTRIAGSDPDLWRQIFATNREEVLCALERYERELAALHEALQQRDDARLSDLLQQAKRRREGGIG